MAINIIPVSTVIARIGHRFREQTLAEVAHRIATLPESARAGWKLDYRYETKSNGQLDNVDLNLTLTMEMPVWDNYRNRPKRERDEWDRFYRALRFHEDGHHNLCKREIETIYSKLSNAKTANDLKSIYDSELVRLQQENNDFDKRVNHGQRQQSPYGTTIINL
jgi:predicted secreted Zn-dependent protease